MQPEAAIIAFAKALPITIRDNLMLFANIYGDPSHDGLDSGFNRMEQDLGRQDELRSLGSVLRWRSVIDFVLARMVQESTAHRARLERVKQATAAALPGGQATIDHLLAAEPLTARHIQAAQERWADLREGPLSDQALYLEEHRRLLPSRSG